MTPQAHTPAGRILTAVLAASLLVLVLGGRARAQDAASDDAVAKITQLNKDAIAAYQAKKFDDARRILKQALDISDSAGLQQHPITARTHIHMGVVIIVGFKQRDLGIKQFKKAIEIESTINLTKSLVTPDLTDAFNEAKNDEKNGAAAAPPAAEAPPAEAAPPEAETPPPEAETPPAAAAPPPAAEEASNGLTHDPVTEGRRGSAISITVGVSSDLKFTKMVLAYRPEGSSDFLGREMKPVAEGRYGAEIPTTATGGNVVAYYVEADDADGNPVASKGSVDSPLTIALGGAAARKASSEAGGESEDEDEAPDHQFFAALLAGSGFGWATGNGDTNRNVPISPPGVAPSTLLQIAPEVGYWFSSSLMLSVQLRYQIITGTTDVYDGGKEYHTAHYAFAAFAKATWKWGDDSFHPFFSLAAGGGYIRHVVTLKVKSSPTMCGGPTSNESCVDTIQAGPILLGPGGGVFYDLTDNLSFVGQANAILGFPDFTAHLDINVGLAYGF